MGSETPKLSWADLSAKESECKDSMITELKKMLEMSKSRDELGKVVTQNRQELEATFELKRLGIVVGRLKPDYDEALKLYESIFNYMISGHIEPNPTALLELAEAMTKLKAA